MRSIDPKIFDRHRRKKATKKKVRLTFVVLLLCTIAAASYQFLIFPKLHPEENEVILPKKANVVDENTPIQEQNQQVATEKKLKFFSGEEFKNFYNTFAYPNVTIIQTPPIISGNSDADDRIRSLAEARGYRLRSSPATSLTKVDGIYLQQKAQQPWLDLKAAAAGAGLQMSVVSSYRSVEDQRNLFLQRLAATGASIEEVAAGTADKDVDYVLKTSSIPGYSRHHTGYTLDLRCGGQNFELFASSSCFSWLSANNYENAKKYGWLPSYPSGAGDQGPDPEAWEYVWVGTDLLYE